MPARLLISIGAAAGTFALLGVIATVFYTRSRRAAKNAADAEMATRSLRASLATPPDAAPPSRQTPAVPPSRRDVGEMATPPSREEPPPPPPRPEAPPRPQPAPEPERSPREYVMAAPVELRFAEGPPVIGVASGSATHAGFLALADEMLADLRRALEAK